MSIGSILYSLLIEPIEILIELAYSLIYDHVSNAGISIVGVSLVVSLFVLPLYLKSDRIQEEEQQKQRSMEEWVQKIRRTFHGDERFMMLQEYYRQQNYSTWNAVRGSVSLLLQIPFFMAAYHYLSNLEMLQNTHFWKIPNLGSPDGLLMIGSLSINLLPVIMTAVNLISSLIYTKDYPWKTKASTFGLAFLFLILLYNSPSGLVIYWICNNLFSLMKNIVTRVAVPLLDQDGKEVQLIKSKIRISADHTDQRLTGDRSFQLFLFGGICLSLLMGLMIPTAVLSSSATEFIDVSNYMPPMNYVIHAFCVYSGFFLVWGGILYCLAGNGGRRRMSVFYFVACGIFIADYMFFGKGHGILSPNLTFESGLKYAPNEAVLNCCAVCIIAAVLIAIVHFNRKLALTISVVLSAAVIILSGIQVKDIRNQLLQAADFIEQARNNSSVRDDEHSFDNIIPLSRSGRNVVVIMLDKAINQYVPFLLQERPEVRNAFEGFTYYPNTTSFGYHTTKGSSGLFGGYEYTPEKIQQRTDATLAVKWNEALTLMPKILSDEGFESVIIDPPYTNFQPYVDPSVFDTVDNAKCYAVEGYLLSDLDRLQLRNENEIKEWGFVFYSLFKSAPVILQPFVYDNGDYHTTTMHDSLGTEFLRAYSVLDHLPDMTKIVDDGDHFFMMDNETSHDPRELQLPDYEPALTVDNSGYPEPEEMEADGWIMKRYSAETHRFYHCNMATFIKLGEWFDFLRREGVYDNTRIIIASDHGARLAQFDGMYLPGGEFDLEGLSGLLLVKDFGGEEYSVDHSFMTIADTPALALKDIAEDPVNPYSGKPVDMKAKETGDFLVTTDGNSSSKSDDGYHLPISNGHWYHVRDNIYDLDNWTMLEDPGF